MVSSLLSLPNKSRTHRFNSFHPSIHHLSSILHLYLMHITSIYSSHLIHLFISHIYLFMSSSLVIFSFYPYIHLFITSILFFIPFYSPLLFILSIQLFISYIHLLVVNRFLPPAFSYLTGLCGYLHLNQYVLFSMWVIRSNLPFLNLFSRYYFFRFFFAVFR